MKKATNPPRARSGSGCVYRPVVVEKRDGRKRRRRAKFYWTKYRGADGRVVRHALRLPNGSGVADKAVAQAELRRLLARQERIGAGLVDPCVESASMPFRTALARYARHLRALRRTRLHVSKSVRRIKWIAETAAIERLGDVDATRVSKALDILAGRDRAPKTINDYRAAVYGMCQWGIKVARVLERNPIEPVPVREAKGDVRKVRRAFTPGEAGRLLATSGPRSLWYETSLFTGLRVGEIRQLAWGDLRLESPAPGVELRAETTKARRGDMIPLKRSLAQRLAAVKPPFARPTDRVFPTTPTRATFRRDCERAGVCWGPDDRGRTLDRHALRTTFVTWLSMVGVEPRVAQQLARHTSLDLTMQTYTDPRLLDSVAAVELLPSLDRPAEHEELAATGTADRTPVVPPVVPTGGVGGRIVSPAGSPAHPGRSAQPVAQAAVGHECPQVAQPLQIGGGGNRNVSLFSKTVFTVVPGAFSAAPSDNKCRNKCSNSEGAENKDAVLPGFRVLDDEVAYAGSFLRRGRGVVPAWSCPRARR